MTTPLRNGTESPFSVWLRKHPDIDSVHDSVNVTDQDYLFQKYRTNVDAMGTRDVQCAMFLELKTFGAKVPGPQGELLYYHHQRLCTMGNSVKVKRRDGREKIALWHFGVCFCVLPKEDPSESRWFKWGQFQEDGSIEYSERRTRILPLLLSFDRRPDTFEPLSLRRHHKVTPVEVEERTELGFTVARIIERRS